MRKMQLIIPTALVMAVIATLGVSVINAKSPRQAPAAFASGSLDVMQMMISANNLPEESYDAI